MRAADRCEVRAEWRENRGAEKFKLNCNYVVILRIKKILYLIVVSSVIPGAGVRRGGSGEKSETFVRKFSEDIFKI